MLPRSLLPRTLHHQTTLCPDEESESSDEYSEGPDTCHPLAELQEQFWQIQDQFALTWNLPPTHLRIYHRVDTAYR